MNQNSSFSNSLKEEGKKKSSQGYGRWEKGNNFQLKSFIIWKFLEVAFSNLKL